MWIRILAVGIVGLVGMGAVAALGRNPAPAPLVEYPVIERAGKTDRLSLIHDRGGDTVVAVADATPSTPVTLVAPPAPQTKPAPEPRVLARDRPEPTDPNLKKQKRPASNKQQHQAFQDEKPIRTVDCNGNGLDALLRSMRLKPGCL